MPTIPLGSKVLVTGASGFIATWVVKTLLEKGFYVRGTVRTPAKGDYLKELFKTYADRFEYVIVKDIAEDGAFDEAVKDMDAVEHTASPFHFRAEDPNDLIIPAVKGTYGVLYSILKNGASVKRVVITSSMAAIIEPADHQYTYTEKIWNNFSIKQVKEKGKDAAPIHKYRTSKTLAEKAAWEFLEKHGSEVTFDITTLNPPLVWGNTIHEVPTAASLNTSLVDFYAVIKGKKSITDTPAGNCVDVRDLAIAHVDALTVEEAGGERFIIATGAFTWQDVIDAIHSGESEPDKVFAEIPRGTPGAGKKAVHPALLDTTKARTILGIKFRQFDEIMKDTARGLLEREKVLGW